jgi:hypothetical protein
MKRYLLTILILSSVAVSLQAEESTNEAVDSPSSEIGQNDSSTDDKQRVGSLNIEAMAQLALSKEVKNHEIVWLDVQYPHEQNAEESPVKVLALQQKSRRAAKHGAVLLLHDKEQHADWPFLIRPLRTSLPEFGWYTLSVNMPYDHPDTLPERKRSPKQYDQLILSSAVKQGLLKATRFSAKQDEEVKDEQAPVDTEVAENPEQSDTDAQEVSADGKPVDIDLAEADPNIPVPYPLKAKAHISAAIEHLNRQGFQNIVIIAYRTAANFALDYIKERRAQITYRGFALVMIDPVLDSAYQENISEALGEDFQAPILDLVNAADLSLRELAAERVSSAQISGVKQYVQVSHVLNERGSFQQAMVRRIRFWLEKYAPGMTMSGRR